MSTPNPTVGLRQRHSGLDRGLWRSFLLWKGFLVLAMVTAVSFAQLDRNVFANAYAKWPQAQAPTLATRFSTWDAAHYLILSEQGYEPGSPSCAFYPLWPAVIRLAALLGFADPLVAAILLANTLSLAGFFILFRLIAACFAVDRARDCLVLMLAFPGALFFSFPYTEALYLLLVAAFFSELHRGRYFWPCVTGFLMPLTRAIGVFIVVPLAWHLFERREHWSKWLSLLAPILGYGAYFGVMYLWTGNAFEGFDAQKVYPNSPSIRNIFDLGGFSNALTNIGSIDEMMDGALDRFFFLLSLVLLPLVYRLNRTWFWYTLPACLIPALTSWFMSYRRYVMVLFPIFIVLAQLLAQTKNRWLFWYYVVLMAALQAWAVKQFVNFNWAG